MILEMIRQANDIKKLNSEQLKILADEIRQFLIEKISRTGGHLASNLGVVELTMPLHLTLDFPEDKLIWDVGHQSYTHKLLTGRKDGFDQLRKYGGMSGFPKRKESDCDAFDTGHSSTSVSAGLGYVEARELVLRAEQRRFKLQALRQRQVQQQLLHRRPRLLSRCRACIWTLSQRLQSMKKRGRFCTSKMLTNQFQLLHCQSY